MQKFGRLVCAIAAVLPLFGVAETYTLAGKDASNASAMNGSGSYGWTDSSGVTTKNHKPSAGNDYVVDQPYCLRTPTTTAFTFAGDSLTLTGGAEMKVKIGSGGTVTIPNLIVAGEARISHGDGNQIKKIAGAIDIREDGEAFFDLSFDNPDGNARQFEILSTISGNGILRAGASDPVKSTGAYVKFSGSLADFTGPIVIRANGSAKLETYFQSTLPGDPSEETADALSVEGENAVLKFMTSGKLGVTRGVSLGSGTCEIYVAEGQSVQIDGLLTGTAGFTKTGKGALALANVSPDLMGTVTVAEGVLQLCDASSRALPNATVSVASGALLDENGPVCGSDLRVVATLKDVRVAEDGQPHGPVLTVMEPTAGYQVTWSVDGGDYTSDYPAFVSPCEHTIDCRVFAAGYLMQSLRATVLIGICRRIVATEAEKEGDWENAVVAGDDAWAAIQGVIDACGVGDMILVKAGSYLLTNALTFASSRPNNIIIRSDDGAGHLARETTIFDGGYPARTNRLFTVEAADVTLEGLTVRNGLSLGSWGGGVYVTGAGFTMTNCIVAGCTALRGGGASFSKPFAVLDCVFTNCSTTSSGSNQRGGGIYCNDAATGGVVRRCEFLGCATYLDAPGCYLESSCTVADCLFEGNRDINAKCYGVIYSAKSQTVERCVFSTNVMRQTHAAALEGTSVVRDCIVANHPKNASWGERGTFHRSGGSVRLQVVNCQILDTFASSIVGENTDLSGCVLSNVTMSFTFARTSGAKVRNCLFAGCPEPILLANCVYENCSFVNNVGGACLQTINGGAVSPALTNCVFWANTPSTAYRGNSGIAVIKNDFAATNRVKMANCVLQSDEETSTEAPNMCDADKSGATAALTAKAIEAGRGLLVAPSRGDAHPRAGSPVVDGGVWCDWMEGANDLDGKPRVVGTAPDVGCYERQGDEIDPPLPCTRAVAKEEDKTGVWTNAFVGIQSAVDAAYDFEPLYVKAGTYNVAEPITLKNQGVLLIGEGAGATIVDGGYPARTNRIFTIDEDNVTLSGLTIRNGRLKGKGQNGGGVYVNANGFTITNCVIDTCGAHDGGGLYWANKTVGGGVLECVFTNCVSDNDGAGLYLYPAKGFVRGTTFADCAAVNNAACCINGAGGVIVDGVFTNCTGNYGGAIRGVSGSSSCAVTNTSFVSCGANAGPAIYSDAGATLFGCRIVDSRDPKKNSIGPVNLRKASVVDACYFSRNQGKDGVTVALAAGSVMKNCIVEDQQRSVGDAGTGVVRYSTGTGRVTVRDSKFLSVAGGSMTDDRVDFENCVFSNVTVGFAFVRDRNHQNCIRDCLFTDCPEPVKLAYGRYENCSFVGNVGGATVSMWNSDKTSPVLSNCVFWANTPYTADTSWHGSMGLLVKADDFDATNRVKMANCVFQSAQETDARAPDIRDADKTGASTALTKKVVRKGPKFVDPENGDWRLMQNSPLRDAALTLGWMTDDATDLDGKPRRISSDGKAYPDSLPDIGCYECDIPKPGFLLQVW